jgi:prepilin-type processing-associated H-X9-DG protein
MSLLIAMLWEGMIHATGFAVVGIVVYLGLRRWSPAAGALGAAATLLVMASLSLLSFSPWPRWEAGVSLERLQDAVLVSNQARWHATAPPGNSAPREPGVSSQTPPAPNVAADRPSMIEALVDTLSQMWGRGAQLESQPWWNNWSSWLAGAIVGSMLIGLARLGTGICAIQRMRSQSQPLDDAPLRDLVELLRAEMGCTRPVQLRVSPELATPATIGWRRILVLLPEDWRDWDTDERRAVLAHELAHVCRDDFLVGLLAQLGLALQFYHPLAHWLSGRLRLEQELAADAWSSRLSGGTLPYLTTLARMALRRDDRALSWPARAFLPSRGTFVRRIEMLRNHGPVPHVWLSSRSRFLTIGLLASTGLLIAGLRGPISPSPVRAQDQPKPDVRGGGGGSPEKGLFDLAYLPAETRILIACRPAAALGRPELAPAAGLLTDLPLPAQEVAQLLIFWEGSPEAPGQPGSVPIVAQPSGVIIRSTKPQRWKDLLQKFLPGAEEVQHSGVTYVRPAEGQRNHMSMSAYFPNDRTAVCAREDLLRTMIEDRNASPAGHVWDDAWHKAAKGEVGVALDTRWLRRRLNQGLAGGGPNAGEIKLDTISPLLEKVRAYAAGVNLDSGLKIDVVAMVGSADDVKPVTETTQALLTLGRNSIPSLRDQARDASPFGEAERWAFGIIASLLEKATIETAGQTIRLRSGAPVDVAQASRILSSVGQAAKLSASRVQAVNNLKQIGLAFYNYHDLHKHFPPPVLYGGKSGKVPYSWRVAILPFLEQTDLYNAYNFDEPWDGPNNSKLLDKMPAIYRYPGIMKSKPTHAAFFVFTGPDTMLGKGDKPDFADVLDGTSNTLLAVEAKREIPWTKPEDIPFTPEGPLPELGGFTPEGFNVLFGDGSVRYIKKSVKPDVLKALITRAGGEVLSTDSF